MYLLSSVKSMHSIFRRVLSPAIPQLRQFSNKIYPSFTVYEPEAVFQVSPIQPEYVQQSNYLKTKRVGSLLLSWAKQRDGSYDYTKKLYFALTPSEIGLVLEVLDSKIGEITITHTPNRNDQTVQTTERILRVFSPQSSNSSTSRTKFELAGDFDATTTLSTGETRVLKELLTYCLPRLYGFHSVLEGPLNIGTSSPQSNQSGNQNRPRSSQTSQAGEWPF
ncbi:unnamed protein product [Albugo candida]|nr:unnamed protein product [Albugo candida]|eukprot:CCI44426.1 unnamed protein product [Albugo candida]